VLPACDRESYLGSIAWVKVSVSLPDEDIEFLDSYALEQGIGSRSAVVHKAVRLLRAVELSDDYQQAWSDWSDSGDDVVWDVALADGVGP
jgi:Arc/MetJ-type ribon-helix-helix transcriptional regulator